MTDRRRAILEELVRRKRAQSIAVKSDQAVMGVAQGLPPANLPSPSEFTTNLPMGIARVLTDPTVQIGMGKRLNDYGENFARVGQRVGEFAGVLGPNDRQALDRRLGANDQADRAFTQAHPTADMVGSAVTDVAATSWVPGSVGGTLARAASGALGTLARAVSGALLGGSVVAMGTGVDQSPWTNFAIGATLGGAVPVLGKAVGAAVNRLSTKPIQVINPTTGGFTDEAIRVLEKSGLTTDDFVDDVGRHLREGGIKKEMLERYNLFREMGLEPTTPQVTRMNDDFILQQELRKNSNRVTTRLAEQDAILGQHMDRMITNAGGQSADNIDAGILLSRTVFDRVNQVDDAISGAYQTARQTANKAKIVSVPRLASKLRQFASQDSASDGLLSAVWGDLQQRGLLDDAMSAQGRKGSVELVEEARKVINALSQEKPQTRSRLARELKEALDADVAAAVGDDVFKDARKMKATFERSLERGRTTRRDAGKDTLLEMLVDNRSNPDQLIDAISRKSTRSEDVVHLKGFLESGTAEQVQAGRQALAEVKTAILRDLYKKATTGNGGMTEALTLEFSGPKFQKALDALGNQKLTALFDADELSMLGRISRIGELRVPPPMTQLGGGPSGRGALAAAGQDVMALVDMGDPQTSMFTRLTGAVFRRVRQASAEKRVLDARSQLQKAIPHRVPADQL